jgi:hypothetical protein
VAPNVVVTREELCANMGLGGFAGGWVSRVADELPVHERRPVEHVHVAGHRAQVRCLEWTVQGTTVVQLVALLTADGHGYAVVCTAPAQAFEELEPGFRTVFEGLRLTPAERV